jgi:hypothetical protein
MTMGPIGHRAVEGMTLVWRPEFLSGQIVAVGYRDLPASRRLEQICLIVVAGAEVAGVAIVFRGRTGDRSHYPQRLVTVPCC